MPSWLELQTFSAFSAKRVRAAGTRAEQTSIHLKCFSIKVYRTAIVFHLPPGSPLLFLFPLRGSARTPSTRCRSYPCRVPNCRFNCFALEGQFILAAEQEEHSACHAFPASTLSPSECHTRVHNPFKYNLTAATTCSRRELE